MKYFTLIQARVNSKRRPGKVKELINQEELLAYQIKRLKSAGIENIIVATTINSEDDVLEQIARRLEVFCFRGSVNNLIERYHGAINVHGIEVIIRVGGDDPLIDPDCVKELIWTHKNKPADFIYASHRNGWIYGTAAELIDSKVIKLAFNDTTNDIEKEHIIPYIKRKDSVKKVKLTPNSPKLIRPDIFLSVDYQEDIEIIFDILNYFRARNRYYTFTQSELIELIDSGIINLKNKHLHEGFID